MFLKQWEKPKTHLIDIELEGSRGLLKRRWPKKFKKEKNMKI